MQKGFGDGDYGDLFPVVDVEAPVDRSITTAQLLNWVDRFRKRFEKRTRRRLMLYTGAFFIDIYDNFLYPGKGYILSDMPLWIAMYTSIKGNPPYPMNQGTWTKSKEKDISGYNLYLNNAYAGTASKDATTFKIDASKFKIPAGTPLIVSIEPFDLDNDFATKRTETRVKEAR